jgi:hypothetical protein
MTGKDPVAIADFDGGCVCAGPTTGSKDQSGSACRTPRKAAPATWPWAKRALELIGQQSVFVYQRPSGATE